MNTEKEDSGIQTGGLIHPQFESLVDRIIATVDKQKLTDLRRDFHTRLRITLSQPEKTELIEDLWDFFYDWCVFEQKLPEVMEGLSDDIRTIWSEVKGGNQRGLYLVNKLSDDEMRLKELFTNETYELPKNSPSDFVGISKGDIIEGRLVGQGTEKKMKFSFVRRPSYHPLEVHDYIKRKVKEFKKAKDFTTYQTWLWLLVGMYLKHRIYDHMPIEKIYDDNSRI